MKELPVKNSQVYLPKYVILLFFLSDVSKERDPDFQSEERKQQRIFKWEIGRFFRIVDVTMFDCLKAVKKEGKFLDYYQYTLSHFLSENEQVRSEMGIFHLWAGP